MRHPRESWHLKHKHRLQTKMQQPRNGSEIHSKLGKVNIVFHHHQYNTEGLNR